MFDFRLRYRALDDIDDVQKDIDPLVLREKLVDTFQISKTLYTNIKAFMDYNTLTFNQYRFPHKWKK